jgi:hypothetical protein
MRFRAAFWIWLNHTSVATILGLPAAGGQAHIAFGRSESEITQFFRGTRIRKIANRWTFRVEPYGDISRWTISFYVNPPHLERAGECRVASQSLRSDQAYPLWRRLVIPIPRRSLPRQLVIFFRDGGGLFQARVLDGNDLYRLPIQLQHQVVSTHGPIQARHLHDRRGPFKDLRCPIAPSQPLPPETSPSGSSLGTGRSRPLPTTAQPWQKLSRLLTSVGRVRTTGAVRRITSVLRRRNVTALVLRCFGARCQARGCDFTSSVAEQVRECVLHVHHIRELGRGGDDSPYNLSVLCANHHALCHRAPQVRAIFSTDSDDVLMTYAGGSFLLERNLAPLRRTR